MSKSFLNSTTVILTLFVLLSLFVTANLVFGLIQFKSLTQVRTLWYSHYVLFLLSGVMISIYYFRKSYRIPFLTTLTLIVIGFFHYGAITLALENNAWDRIESFIAVSGIINTIITLIYGLSLILTEAAREKWLRIYGYSWVVIAFLNVGGIIEFFNHSSHFTKWLGMIESFASSIVMLFLILNLRTDLNNLHTNDNLLDDDSNYTNF